MCERRDINKIIMASAPRFLVLDCGSITNSDATADMAALTAAMGAATETDAKRGMDKAWAASRANADMDAVRYWTVALTEAGVAAEQVDTAAIERCEACVHRVLSGTFQETIDAAASRKAEGKVMVGVISNHITSPPWFQVCAEAAKLYELASDPSLVVVSQEAGVSKPDPAIFKLFMEKLRALEPAAREEEVLFVDDKEKNVSAAVALGWQGLVFNAATATPGAFATALAQRYGL